MLRTRRRITALERQVEQLAEQLSARSLRIVDEDGRARLTLAVTDAGIITLTLRTGSEQEPTTGIELFAVSDDHDDGAPRAGLVLYDAGEVTASWTLDPYAATLAPNRAPPSGSQSLHSVRGVTSEGNCQPHQGAERWCGVAALHVGDVGRVDAGALGQLLLGEAGLGPSGLQTLAELLGQGLVVGSGAGGRHGPCTSGDGAS